MIGCERQLSSYRNSRHNTAKKPVGSDRPGAFGSSKCIYRSTPAGRAQTLEDVVDCGRVYI